MSAWRNTGFGMAKERRWYMAKECHWYDDATLYAWWFAVEMAGVSGVPCLAGGITFCVPSLALAFLVSALVLTVPLVYLNVTFKRRPDSPSADLREDAKTK
jgi:hypothetical protein